MATISVRPAVIAARASLSGAVDLTGVTAVVGVVMPTAANWTSAVVSLQGSPDGTNFYDMYDGVAAQELIFNAKVGSIVMLNPNRMRCCKAIIIRSGTKAAPVTQPNACTFGVVVET